MSKPRLAQIYEAFLDGGDLTDDDLSFGVQQFGCVAHILNTAGPQFALAAKEANRVMTTFGDYREARDRDRRARRR